MVDLITGGPYANKKMKKNPDGSKTPAHKTELSQESELLPKPGTTRKASSPTTPDASLENLGELPRSYGTDAIFLVAQEPHWLFTYWDIDIALHPGGKTFLRVLSGGSSVESEIEVPFETRNWYIPVQNAGAEYQVEIGYYRGETWNVLASSISIRTPQDKISDSGQFDYATIPLHMSFHRLMENIQTTIQGGETLIQALGRLQREGKLLAFGPDSSASPGPDERLVLEALLGKATVEELSSSGLSSEELSSRIHSLLQERVSSGGASEFLGSAKWGPSESSLFSALSTLTGTTSWSAGALSSWAAAALTSWAAAARSSWSGGAAGESSWGKAEQSSSFGQAALSSWLQAAASSWAETGQSSWSAAAFSSWLQASGSSWPGAEMSSWSQAALASWSEAAMSSWGHAETSSWGGSETTGSFGLAQREFFMHVNAEVIFYGGTHPQAKVTIDGKPVKLNPDGTFRHHFIFPDGVYGIPIVATSPDGVETRSATLNFCRSTERQGEVGHTSQPAFDAPMGAKI